MMAMRLLGAALVAVMLAGPAAAAREDRPLGSEIWNGLRVGMTRAQVKAIVPQRRLSLTPYCDGQIRPKFERGRLVQVRIDGAGRNTPGQNCGEIVRQSLMTKYGARDERTFNRYGRWDERRFPTALYAVVRGINAENSSAIAWDLPTQQILFVARGTRNDWRITTEQLRDWRVIYVATPQPVGQTIPAL